MNTATTIVKENTTREISQEEWIGKFLLTSKQNLSERRSSRYSYYSIPETVEAPCPVDPERHPRMLADAVIAAGQSQETKRARVADPSTNGMDPAYLQSASSQTVKKPDELMNIAPIAVGAWHTASLWGEVIAIEGDALVVRFDVDGVPEVRKFYWEEMAVQVKDVTEGMHVIGRTELVPAPGKNSALSAPERLKAITEATRREMETLGIKLGDHGCRILASNSAGDTPGT